MEHKSYIAILLFFFLDLLLGLFNSLAPKTVKHRIRQ